MNNHKETRRQALLAAGFTESVPSPRIDITVEEDGTQHWFVMEGNQTLAGGSCATREDALSDANIWIKERRPHA